MEAQKLDHCYRRLWGPVNDCFKEICLNLDSTFVYKSGCGLSEKSSRGIWFVEGDSVVFTSYVNIEPIIVQSTELLDTTLSLQVNRIQVKDISNQPMLLENIFINDDYTKPYQLDLNGEAEVKTSRVESIIVGSQSRIKYTVKNSGNNVYELRLNHTNLTLIKYDESYFFSEGFFLGKDTLKNIQKPLVKL